MNIIYRKSLLSILALILCSVVFANNDNETKVTKTIKHGDILPKNGFVEVINKYGQVVVTNSDSDSVTVKIEVIAYGKDHLSANKIMDRVDFDFDLTGQFLTIETVLDRKSGTFQEVWNSIGDYSKSLLSKNKLQVNYTIQVPEHATLSITNKFGDLYIAERNKKTEIDLAHGNLRANNFNGPAKIAVSYGDTRIKYMKSGDLILKGSDTDIKELGVIDMSSSSSTINIGKANELDIDSRSDRSIEIGEVKRISGKMSFSNLEVEEALKSVDLQMSYSDIEIEHMPFSFSLLRISGRTSDINVSLDSQSFVEIDIQAEENDLHLPLSNLNKEYIDEKKGIVRVTGTLGTKKNYKGNINIDAEGGSVTLNLQAPSSSSVSN